MAFWSLYLGCDLPNSVFSIIQCVTKNSMILSLFESGALALYLDGLSDPPSQDVSLPQMIVV